MAFYMYLVAFDGICSRRGQLQCIPAGHCNLIRGFFTSCNPDWDKSAYLVTATGTGRSDEYLVAEHAEDLFPRGFMTGPGI